MAATLDSRGSPSAPSLDRPRFWSSLEPTYSLDDVPEFDPDAEISSPRSLEACEIEGVPPEELVYTPFAEFDLPGLAPEVVRMRHDFHEARRQDLLAVVRHRRQALFLNDGVTLKLESPSAAPTLLGSTSGTGTLGSTSPAKSKKLGATSPVNRPKSSGLLSPGEHDPMAGYTAPGAPPSIAPFPITYVFFNTWQKELDPHKEIPKEGRDASADLGSSYGSPMASQSFASPMSGGEEAGSDEVTSLKPKRTFDPKDPHSKRLEAHEPYFLDQLQKMRSCSGASRVEHDAAKNTENHLVVLRNDAERARAASQAGDKHTTNCRNTMQEHCFERLLGDCLQNREKREHRDLQARMSLSLEKNLKADARNQLVFENQATVMKELVNRRSEYYDKRTGIEHARTERLAMDHVNKKMAIAQQVMEERLRWRETHHVNVTVKTAKYEEDKKRMFAQREADFIRRSAIKDNRGGLRQELHRLRHINRQMNEELRTRKAAYQKNKEKAELAEWKDGINQAAIRAARPKMRSNLAQSWPLSPASLEKSMSSPSLSLAMSRPVPTHQASPMSAALRTKSDGRLYSSWYRHG